MLDSKSTNSKLKVAVVQAAPCLLNLQAGIEKAIAFIDEAGQAGAKIINFPELWLPGYPWWIWLNPPAENMQYAIGYIKNSLVVDDKFDQTLRKAACRNSIHVIMGLSERMGSSLYIAQWHYGPEGEVLWRRRKLKPTHVERSVFGEGDGSGLIVAGTEYGRLGALCCWEHLQPLMKFALYSQNEEIHCAATPTYGLYTKLFKAFSPEISMRVYQIYALEGQCFVLSACSIIDKAIFNQLVKNEQQESYLEMGGGYSRIFAPDGSEFKNHLPHNQEGLLIDEIDLDQILAAKTTADPAGHYARADAVALLHNHRPRYSVIDFNEIDF
ncbi:carbon-nitrogen hydrolase family protein [Microbulbifer sp. THAF38]|uniref:carbon-nitrogen hydrolase family protein n=1 Tax=Microbulbifer sp. THAF38 TaxID=2587856 RepID=UPI0012680BC5|nr:carbon-nitrogen hydrolase family protein [Microbulbifer sp. THAF38]QFT54219.1 Nitrilase [Microbulbifer sp. THAF38]